MDRDTMAATFSGMNYLQLSEVCMQLKEAKSDLKKQLADIDAQIDYVTIELIPEKLAEDGFSSVNLDNGKRIQLSSQAYCSTRAGQKEALFEWLQEHEFGELITEVVNPSTLKAFVKEQLEEGNEVPPDEIVNYQPFMRASVVNR